MSLRKRLTTWWNGIFPPSIADEPLRSKLAYILERVRDKYNDISWWKRQVIFPAIIAPIQGVLRSEDAYLQIMQEDWDTLLILDGCRADLFEELVELEEFDDYHRSVSPASQSLEWFEYNFQGKEFGDTVYVSANPYTSIALDEEFHEVWDLSTELFNSEKQTILPEDIVERAEEAHDQFPNKRIVVHLMQPHQPFVHSRISYDKGEKLDWMHLDEEYSSVDIWRELEKGRVAREKVWESYKDNLEYVLGEIQPLIDEVEGKIAITSDHGNALGERISMTPFRVYGHPPRVRLKPLNEVPYATIDGKRRMISAGETTQSTGRDVEDQLRAFGYLE